MSKNQKIAAGAVAVAAIAVGSAVLLRKAVAAGAISISVSPTSLPSSGGTVTVTGTTSLADGTTLYAFLNGTMMGSVTVSGGGFSTQVTISPNDTTSPVTDQIWVSDSTSGD